jgi:hypothetical protein
MSDLRKKIRKSHAKEALKDMVPPTGTIPGLEEDKDLDELLDDAIKKIKEKK